MDKALSTIAEKKTSGTGELANHPICPARSTTWNADDRYFGDGPPHWQERRTGKPAKTAAQAGKQRSREIRLLRKWRHLDFRADPLADLIDACCPAYRCGSAACAECWRASQRCFVKAIRPLRPTLAPVSVVSIIPSGQIPLGELSPEHFRGFAKRVRRALRKCDVPYAAGGIDINVNEASPDLPSSWKLQAWVFMPKLSKKQLRRLNAYFPAPKDDVCVPVREQEFDGKNAGLAYAVKGDFVRRQTILRQQREDGSFSRQNTRDRALRAEQAVELLIVRHELGFQDRLLLHRTILSGTSGRLRIEKA